MSQGSIIGYDINSKYCQISIFNKETGEPETLESGKDTFQIPLVLNYYKDTWTYGRHAKRMSSVRGSVTIEDVLEKALKKEIIHVEEDVYDAVHLLDEFVKQTLQSQEKIESITFSVPEMSEDVRVLLKGIGQHLGVPKDNIYVQDYKESFCHYMFNQPKELWQYEAALFYCDDTVIRAYMLRELKTMQKKAVENFVTVDKVADAEVAELKCVYPVLDIGEAKAADEQFKCFIESVFDKKRVSSVFLTGEGFENNWYPNSLRVLCNGRRTFMGNNLYSKGACYTAVRRLDEQMDSLVYLDETKMTEQISLRMRVDGEEGWHPIVPWGSHWYESDKQYELLMDEKQDIEIRVDSLSTGKRTIEVVSMEGVPERKNYSLRLRVSIRFEDEKTCHLLFEDIGFGEFYPATDFKVDKVIELGGSNGQFNSLS